MSWIVDCTLSGFQRFCVNVLKCGPIPHHVAIIMDGNRRYARKSGIEKAEGHVRGFDKLSETLQWCRQLGINEVTVYAFSNENFKRSADEVDTLLELATEKFRRLLEEKEKIMEEGVCIRVIGNVGLLTDELRGLIAEAMLLTKDNTKAFLNVAFAYTSREEILQTAHTISEGRPSEINEELVTKCLYTSASPSPDILIRTSGEVRLSDFLLWQVAHSDIIFTKVLWPEFSIWNLLVCVFKYQRNCKYIQNGKLHVKNEEIEKFVDYVNQKRIVQFQGYLS